MKPVQTREVHTMKIKTAIFAIALCSCIIALPTAFARTTTPQKSSAQVAQSAHADIVNATGQKIGTATFSPTSGGVRVDVDVTQLPPGTHGIHIHTVGKCEGPDFKTAGGHLNPTSAHHGVNNTMDPHPHAGDLPNITVAADGKGSASVVDKDVTLGDGANSLIHDG